MSASSAELRPRMGFWGATFTLIGFVVGMAIFVLPGEVAATVGPGVFLAYLLAGALALFSCFVAAQLGAIFPISGAGYVGVGCTLGPFFGVMVVWLILLMMVMGVPALGYAFADYLETLIPGLPRRWVAAAAVATFGGVNLLGVRASVGLQAGMVVCFVGILAVFGVAGLANVDPALMTPLLPNGVGPLLEATIPVYFSFAGFMVIVEMGDEIEAPWRTIPRALAVSFVVVLALYVSVAAALPGIVPWEELGKTKAPLAAAAARFLPAGFGPAIAAAALLGAATSINAWFLTQTRDIYALARDGVFPRFLARVNPKFGEPDAAIAFAVGLATLASLTGGDFQSYAVLVVFGLMLIQIMASLAVLLAPRRVPEQYAAAKFRLGRPLEIFFAVGFLLMSAALLVVLVAAAPKLAGVMAGALVPGAIYCEIRRRAMARAGVRLADVLGRDAARILERERGGR